MSNLGTWNLNNTDYRKISELTGITFEEGKTYTLQITSGQAYIREGLNGAGFLIDNTKPFQYTAGTDDLFIKVTVLYSCVLNIGD